MRAIDAGNISRVNHLAAITERLELPSTDITITAVRSMLDRLKARNQGSDKLRAWVIDEEHAYRGIGIHPSQKRFAVVAMKDPASGKVVFFLMIGHAFGWSAAVYNLQSTTSTEALRLGSMRQWSMLETPAVGSRVFQGIILTALTQAHSAVEQKVRCVCRPHD